MSSSGNAKTGPTGIVVDVDEYSASGSTMLKDIVKIIKSVFANHENATCSALSREVKVTFFGDAQEGGECWAEFVAVVVLNISVVVVTVNLFCHRAAIFGRNRLKQSTGLRGSVLLGRSSELIVRTHVIHWCTFHQAKSGVKRASCSTNSPARSRLFFPSMSK